MAGTVVSMASTTSTDVPGAISLVDQLLDLRKRVAITQQDIMEATGASLGEVNAWLKREGGPVGEEAKLLGDLVTVVDRLALGLDPEGLPDWLRRKVPALEGRTPLEVVRAGGYATLAALADEILDPPFA